MVEEEEGSDDESGYERCKYPRDRQMPELNEEDSSVGAGRSEGFTYLERLLVQRRQLAYVRETDEDDDTDRCGIL